MPEYAEIYVAEKSRSKSRALEFLNHFLPKRKESADEYEIPQYSRETQREFKTVDELLSFLELNENVAYNLYWHSIDDESPNKHGMLFYTPDGGIIYGISRDAEINGLDSTSNEDDCLVLMKQYFKTEIAYITYEDTPIETFESFESFVKEMKK